MKLESISFIATSAAALISAISLFTAFWLYWLGKRDEYLSGFRRSVSLIRSKCKKLNAMLDQELSHEITASVLKVEAILFYLQNFYEENFKEGITITENDIKENMIPVIAAMRTESVTLYEQYLTEVDAEAAQHLFTFPAFARLTISSHNLFRNILRTMKRVSTAEELWCGFLFKVVMQERTKLTTFEAFKHHIGFILIAQQVHTISESQKTINDLLELIDLLSDSYLSSPNRQLQRRSKQERSIPIKPISETETITEDLRETEKVLHTTLGQNELLHFRELVARIETRFNRGRD